MNLTSKRTQVSLSYLVAQVASAPCSLGYCVPNAIWIVLLPLCSAQPHTKQIIHDKCTECREMREPGRRRDNPICQHQRAPLVFLARVVTAPTLIFVLSHLRALLRTTRSFSAGLRSVQKELFRWPLRRLAWTTSTSHFNPGISSVQCVPMRRTIDLAAVGCLLVRFHRLVLLTQVLQKLTLLNFETLAQYTHKPN
jgi:hypothetical protein